MTELLQFLALIVDDAPAAQALWATLEPILEQKREPTEAERETLNKQADLQHLELQAS